MDFGRCRVRTHETPIRLNEMKAWCGPATGQGNASGACVTGCALYSPCNVVVKGCNTLTGT